MIENLEGVKETHVVVICMPHLQAAIPPALGSITVILITANIPKGVTPLPLALAAPYISLHGIRHGEVVPGTNE